MRIVLTTNTGRQSFENVSQVIIDEESLLIWCESSERNKRMLANCIDMHVEFTPNEKKETKQRKVRHT